MSPIYLRFADECEGRHRLPTLTPGGFWSRKPFGQSQHVNGAGANAGLGGLHGIVPGMDRRGRAGQIEDLVYLDIERKRHVMPQQLEAMMIEDAVQIAPSTREKIIGANYACALFNQTFAKVRTKKSIRRSPTRGFRDA